MSQETARQGYAEFSSFGEGEGGMLYWRDDEMSQKHEAAIGSEPASGSVVRVVSEIDDSEWLLTVG